MLTTEIEGTTGILWSKIINFFVPILIKWVSFLFNQHSNLSRSVPLKIVAYTPRIGLEPNCSRCQFWWQIIKTSHASEYSLTDRGILTIRVDRVFWMVITRVIRIMSLIFVRTKKIIFSTKILVIELFIQPEAQLWYIFSNLNNFTAVEFHKSNSPLIDTPTSGISMTKRIFQLLN